MTILFSWLGRFAITALMVAVGALFGSELWAYYVDAPWTRDGRVRADIVAVAPDVSGLVTDVLVQDNEIVRRGDLLFRIDRERFALALQQAQAVAEGRLAALTEANSDLARYKQLSDKVVSQQKFEQVLATQQLADAAYKEAVAQRDVAKLNLDRSDVRASVNGAVTNFDLRPGAYVSAGKGVFALVDSDSLHIEGYFEETKLPRIHAGDRVSVRLMGESRMLTGRVESIAGAIEDRERSAGASLVANVNPTFSWVRLAQRVPVRIALDETPQEVRLLPGRTATVSVDEPQHPSRWETTLRLLARINPLRFWPSV
ncbi:efflux transporter, RND family, MFP subunit [Methylocella silvestris BL2]|uniref:Efflux transporter, RND family, MFP subunit n=1 Tax=Methylocella silvestris (strain DSM 15510 / CIP 108128 / LMG 27833 / NCIMB 13906 / BL2) TaxID=395965 RepID=B8ES30_METSB|nr:HlyD family secretion protein [Methylocella silvestris]ACK52245.1 efflux transporter, RND family, MFP subunit [Methylocella silvestris BL2]